MKRLFDFLFAETPLIAVIAISLFISGALFYFLVPQPPKVVYTFDVQKFKEDLVARAGLSKASERTVDLIVAELRKTLDRYAEEGKTVVINRRAYLAGSLERVQIVDITQQVERELFDRFLPVSPDKAKLMEELLGGKNKNRQK
jgi:hypothetical protein